jgi:hypothetical protein
MDLLDAHGSLFGPSVLPTLPPEVDQVLEGEADSRRNGLILDQFEHARGSEIEGGGGRRRREKEGEGREKEGRINGEGGRREGKRGTLQNSHS